MNTYHKIQTVFKRDPETKYKTLLEWGFAREEFEYLRKNKWLFTEKVDGMNIRVMYHSGAVTFGGKSDNAQIHAQLVTKLSERFHPQLELFMEKFEDADVCFYGEGYGPGIQKGGGNYGPEKDFVLFDVKIGEWWLQRKDVEDIAGAFGIPMVPSLGTGNLDDLVDRVRNGVQSLYGDFPAEGIVARPATELVARNGQRIITKLKCCDFAS